MSGQVESDINAGPALYGDTPYYELSVSRGEPAAHSGIGIGPAEDDDSATARYLGLLSASLGTSSQFAAAVAALPTLSDGPFPDVVPATWWGSLPAYVRWRLQACCALKARRVG